VRDSFGLPNRTMFCNSVRARVCEWKRGGPPFSVLLLRIQPQGKSPGEGPASVPARVLQAVATLIQSVVRDMDVLGYYAPACFCLLMPEVDPVASVDITRRLEEQLSHLSTNPVDLQIGAAAVSEGDDAVSLLKRAETGLRGAERREHQSTDSKG